MRGRLPIIVVCSFLLTTIAMVAQEIPSDEIFWGSHPYAPEIAGTSAIRVQSDLVEVPTVVRDSTGIAVGNLKKSDFLLFDNGKPQTISTFSVLTGPRSTPPAGPDSAADPVPPLVQPRYVAFYFDNMNLYFGNIGPSISTLTSARDAAIRFIRKGLDPGERVGVFTASGDLNLDFTNDVHKLLETLAKIRVMQRMPDQAPFACPQLTTGQAWEMMHTPMTAPTFNRYDNSAWVVAIRAAQSCGCKPADMCALMEAQAVVSVAENYSLDTLDSITRVIRHLGDMPGRRIFLLASTGFLTSSFLQKQQKIIEAAVRASVVINSLDTAGLPAGRGDPWGTHYNLGAPMSRMAEGTGGKFIHNSNDIESGFRDLSAAPSVSYVLGFSPTNLKIDGLEHKLKVQLAEPAHLTVGARPSYYAPSPELSPAEKRFRKLEQSVMAGDTPTEIPVEFTATPEKLPSGELSLKALVHVDTGKLPFQVLSERHTERLIFITALFDAKNQFLTGVQGVMDLRLKEATLKQITAQGLDAKLSIQAPAGSYRVRQVVQEVVGGHITALSRTVEIR